MRGSIGKRAGSLVVIAILAQALVGCATGSTGSLSAFSPPSNPNLTPAEQELRANVRQQRVLESAAIGCLATGGITAMVNLMAGADTDQTVRDAAIGCVAGGVVGAAAGAYVDARAQSFADEQQRLAALSNAAREDAQRYHRLNVATQQLIDEEKVRIAAAKKQAAGTQVAIAEQQSLLAKQQENLKLLESQKAELEGNVQTIAQDEQTLASQGSDASALEADRLAMEREHDELDKRIVVLKDMYQKPA